MHEERKYQENSVAVRGEGDGGGGENLYFLKSKKKLRFAKFQDKEMCVKRYNQCGRAVCWYLWHV